MTWLLVVLVLIPFIDLTAAWILVRAARRPPRIPLLYDRARAAVLATLASELIALLALAALDGIALPEPLATALFAVGLLLPGAIPVLFLADYLLGRYSGETT